jgi:D-alanine-D-alanine ligase
MVESKNSITTLIKEDFFIDTQLIKNLKLVGIAYANVKREMFPTEEAYNAEAEVLERADGIMKILEKAGIKTKGYPADEYFLVSLLVDKPDFVINLVDTVKGKDRFQPFVPASLELMNIQYTGTGMTGLVIGNDRNLFKELLRTNKVPTPDSKYFADLKTKVPEDFPMPVMVKLNECGGSVGIDNHAVKKTVAQTQKQVEDLITKYRVPVIVERYINGPEITAVVYDDGNRKYVYLAEKVFHIKPDGEHEFTSNQSYEYANAYTYKFLDEAMIKKIEPLVMRAFRVLHNQDYAKFDIRLGEEDGVPYFIDCNPNTAFGPSKGLPMTEVLDLHGVKFEDLLMSLLSKHAKINTKRQESPQD